MFSKIEYTVMKKLKNAMVDKLLKKTLYVFMLLVIRYIYSFYLFCRMRA